MIKSEDKTELKREEVKSARNVVTVILVLFILIAIAIVAWMTVAVSYSKIINV